MPIPFILGALAVAAGVGGVGAGIKGAIDMADANDTLSKAKKRDEENQQRHKNIDEQTCKSMDMLGGLEMNILASFKNFAYLIEKIKKRPTFADIKIGNVTIPKYDQKELEQASVGAAVLVGGLGGAALGAAGGYAAAGATTAAVMALGTASTGTAIASLSGAAATNATLAALGGGSLAAGGGGMALGSAVLGGATLGVGLLVGGIIFRITGSKLSDKADEAYKQMLENEKVINKICIYLESLNTTAKGYYSDLSNANSLYLEHMKKVQYIVDVAKGSDGKVDWMTLRPTEKTTISNLVMLVGLLYHMCKVKLVNQSTSKDEVNTINTTEINKARKTCKETLKAVDPAFTPNNTKSQSYTPYEIESKVKSVIAKACNRSSVNVLSGQVISCIGGHVGSICAQLENAFGIRIDADEVREIQTVGDAIKIVSRHF